MEQENQKKEKEQDKSKKSLKNCPERNVLGKRIHKEKKHHNKSHG
ncbi:MAG: hypothetical protein ACK4ND_09630 [Cytophagaceae bacterium]